MKNKTGKGFWHAVKTVGHFLLLLTVKGFSKRSKPVVDPIEKPVEKKRAPVILQLFKSLSRSVKGSIDKEMKETRGLLQQKKRQKKQFKTWARVKQDFRDYYRDMIEEFEGEETNALLKNTLDSETE